MRITTLLFALLVAAYFIQGFAPVKCEHVFVQVEQAEIKIKQPSVSLGGVVYQEYSWPTGLQEGKELICVKCFHKQKQILDYGKLEQTGPTLGSLGFDTCFFLGSKVLQIDTTTNPGSIIRRSGKAVICLEAPLVHDCGPYWYSDSDRIKNKTLFDSVKKWTHETGVHYFTDSDRALIKKYNDSIKILESRPLRHRAKNSKKKIN